MKYLTLASNAEPNALVLDKKNVDKKLVNGIIENTVTEIKANTEANTETNTYILLRLEVKEILNAFYDQYLQEDSICSERLNDVYALYIQFLEQNYSNNVEILKKRSFKLALKTVLESRNIFITPVANNTGVLLRGIGIKPNFNNQN